jgi:hypothetical protein
LPLLWTGVGHGGQAAPYVDHGDDIRVEGLGIPAEVPAQVLDQGRDAERAGHQVEGGVPVGEVHLDDYLARLGWGLGPHEEP